MIFRSRKIHLLLILVLPLTFASAQEIPQFSLQEAINYALTNSNTLRTARISIADAEQQIIERRAVGLPQLSAEVSYQHYLRTPPLPPNFSSFGDIFGQFFGNNAQRFNELDIVLPDFGPSNGNDSEPSIFFKNNFNLGLNLDAMIFDGSYFTGLRAARVYRQYVQKEYATKERDVRDAVVEAYLPVVLLQENIKLLDKNIANLEKLLFETREMYKAGFAEQLDIDRQELSLTNLKTDRDNLIRQQEMVLRGLKMAMGFPVEAPLSITEELEAMDTDIADADLSGEINFRRRPEFDLINLGLQLNELNVKLNRDGYLPTLNAFGAYQQSFQGNNSEDGFWAPNSFVGLRLNLPIFDGLNKKARVQRARLDLESVQIQKNDLERLIRLEVFNARTSYLNAREQLQSQERNLQLADRIYETTRIKYREGVGSSLEVTQAEQSLYTTQSNYLQALYNLLLAKSELEMALGTSNQ